MRYLVTPTPASAAVAGLLAAGVVAGLFVRRRFVVVRVSGTSMVPTYRPGDRVLVRRGGGAALRRGQVVIFRHGSRDGTGSGLPDGSSSPDGVSSPDGTNPGSSGGARSPYGGAAEVARLGGTSWLIKRIAAVPGDRVPDQVMAGVRAAPGDLVPAGRLVVLGDDPASMDSRRWGYLRTDEVLGVVVRGLSR
ncbi:S26 family signal peptidase [Microbispora sp. NBC_01389]|uniref:S26 family signal peptidase n=1 Tax=Microbispora sp. NBC_01389 TaxID=2903584 RepID=UPI00324A56D4